RVGRMRIEKAILHPEAIGLERRLVEQMAEALAELVVAVIVHHDRAIAHPERVLVVVAERKPANLRRPPVQSLPIDERLPSVFAALRHARTARAKRYGRSGNEPHRNAHAIPSRRRPLLSFFCRGQRGKSGCKLVLEHAQTAGENTATRPAARTWETPRDS